MNTNTLISTVSSPISALFTNLLLFIPNILIGLIILIVGLFVAAYLKQGVYMLYKLIRLEQWVHKDSSSNLQSLEIWKELFAELVRWTTVILFLIPAMETWGITRFTEVLNSLLVYLPNVFVAVVVSLVGAVIANFLSDIVRNGAKALGSKSSALLESMSYYSVIIFTILVVLNQLGIASNLIQILFTGIVAMFALAGGLAFGLGGQDFARDILKELQRKLK